ncbi:DNase I-like protein [Trametopsis cervina]|nr:DNase I-like protein [Trametopsis cervina]
MSKRLATARSLSPSPRPKRSRVIHQEQSLEVHASRTTILSWNVETPVPFLTLPAKKIGSSTSHARARPMHLRELLARDNYPDYLCLQEVRARQSDADWLVDLKDAVNGRTRDDGPKYTPYTSLSRSTHGPRHFGVITYAKDPESVSTYREVDWDSEGRVVILEMKSGWALVNVYALNGSEYMWKDPTGVNLPKTRNERKREFNRLLLKECRAMQTRGLRLVLIGDFNISLEKEDCHPCLRAEYPHTLARKEFNEKFIPGINVVDIFRDRHGDRRAYSWFAKGKPQGTDCARVDYALVERSLVEKVEEIEYLEDPSERAHSDHAPILLVLRDMNESQSSGPSP